MVRGSLRWSPPGTRCIAVNPLQVARYRERHGVSGAKSDPGDAHTLAELVRLDRAHHKPLAPDSTLAEQVKVLARSHQTMIWSRQRQGNLLRSTLREFYPAALVAFGEDLTGRDALAVLAAAPSPAKGAALSASRIEALLRRAGRQRNLERPRPGSRPRCAPRSWAWHRRWSTPTRSPSRRSWP